MREYRGGVLLSEQVLRVAEKDVRKKAKKAAKKQGEQPGVVGTACCCTLEIVVCWPADLQYQLRVWCSAACARRTCTGTQPMPSEHQYAARVVRYGHSPALLLQPSTPTSPPSRGSASTRATAATV